MKSARTTAHRRLAVRVGSNRYAVDAFLKVGLRTGRSDRDGDVARRSRRCSSCERHRPSSHRRHAAGSSTANIKRVEDGLKAAGLFDDYSIWVRSDHGFSTYTGAADLRSPPVAVNRPCAARWLAGHRHERRRDLRSRRGREDRSGGSSPRCSEPRVSGRSSRGAKSRG